MHIETLATGVVTSTVKCTLTVMVMLGFQLWFLLHQVVVTTNTMIFGMIDACSSFIEEGRVQFFTLSSVDSESWFGHLEK